MPLIIEIEQEDDSRWLAEVPNLPGVLTYGQTREEAIDRAQVLSLRVLVDRLDHDEPIPKKSRRFRGESLSRWSLTKARRVLAASLRNGWRVKD